MNYTFLSGEIPDKGPSTQPIMKNISISNKGILKLINNINPKKAVGPDNIAGKIQKENADICSYILTIIYFHHITSHYMF
jgi:hypothetical protein